MDGVLAIFIDRLAYNIANYTGEYIMFGLFLAIYSSFNLYFNYQFKKRLLKRIEANEDKIDRLLEILEEKNKEAFKAIKEDYNKKTKKIDELLDKYLNQK